MKYEELIAKYNELITNRSRELYYPDFKPQKSSRRWYQHDIDMIIYSEMFRKMQRKSQLLSIHDPLSRSRLIHTFEVVRIAKEISEKLCLNSELTEAIALAHDFGNVAYGKCVNDFLVKNTNLMFKHEEASVLMLKIFASRLIPPDYWEEANQIINLDSSVTHRLKIKKFPWELEVYRYKGKTYYVCVSPEVIDGIIKHGTLEPSFTMEGQVVNYADNIAYLIQDISDFEAVGIFDVEAKRRYRSCLKDLESEDKNENYPVTGIAGETTSIRTATLIERYVSYNRDRIENENNEEIYSKILQTDIPILKIEPIVEQAIDCCWKFKEGFYQHELIKNANIESEAKIKQIWNILQEDSPFAELNQSYIDFNKMLEMPIFTSYRAEKEMKDEKEWKAWKKAFFVAHLTCDEIDLIIKSFLERDYVFGLSLPRIILN